jgi:hypothetical protein
MSHFAVYVQPPLDQKWADGSPVLWGWMVAAANAKEAQAVVQNSAHCRGMPVVAVFPC